MKNQPDHDPMITKEIIKNTPVKINVIKGGQPQTEEKEILIENIVSLTGSSINSSQTSKELWLFEVELFGDDTVYSIGHEDYKVVYEQYKILHG